jgi:putative ABC transport system permease protein
MTQGLHGLPYALSTAVDNLRANPLRTLLSTLGVIIGVASLVAILALADGLERYSREQISTTTDLQTVMVTPRTTESEDGVRVRVEEVARLERPAVDELERRLGERATLSLVILGSGRAGIPGDSVRRAVLVAGTEPGAVAQLKEGLVAGRYLRREEVSTSARVVVIPETVAGWYGAEPSAALGRPLELDGVAYEVIGVAGGGDAGTPLQIPLGDRVRSELERPDREVRLAIRAVRVEDVEAVTAEVESWLAERYGSADRFQVMSNKARVAQAGQAMLVFKLIMGAIAGISLLVGGIGIMNILLAGVFERTREIGIRKATGARQRDILLQFLAEAVAVSGAGSVLGVVLGLAGAFGITAAIRHFTDAPIHAGFTWGSVSVAAGAALLVGLVFGTYPARRASRLSPIEAIRHE